MDASGSTDFFAQDARCQSVIKRHLHLLNLPLISTFCLVLSLSFKDRSHQTHLTVKMIHRLPANSG